jgi:hypothetical protein
VISQYEIYYYGERFMERLLRFFDFASLYYIYSHMDKTEFKKHALSIDPDLYESIQLPLNPICKTFTLIPEVFYKTIHEHMVWLREFKPEYLSVAGPGISHVLSFDIAAVYSKNFRSPHL